MRLWKNSTKYQKNKTKNNICRSKSIKRSLLLIFEDAWEKSKNVYGFSKIELLLKLTKNQQKIPRCRSR